jgi:hypothetical protein
MLIRLRFSDARCLRAYIAFQSAYQSRFTASPCCSRINQMGWNKNTSNVFASRMPPRTLPGFFVNTPAQNQSRSPLRHHTVARVRAGIVAGFAAILVNTAMLIAADHLHIVTARGGLLTLLLKLSGSPAPRITTTWGFQQFFHISVGIGMAVAYAISFGDVPASAMLKGLIAAVFVWVVNACVVLPLIGQGFAGYRVLTWLGMLTFALAHTIFFVATALLYERRRRTV